MKYTNLMLKAVNIAYKLHLKEVKDGLPIIYSIFSVASKTNSEYSFCVAVLYKAIDNKKTTLEHLKKDFPFEVTDAINMLITDDSLSYPDYIRRISTNEIAKEVKVFELEDRLNLLELNTNKNDVKAKKEKYEFALNVLK